MAGPGERAGAGGTCMGPLWCGESGASLWIWGPSPSSVVASARAPLFNFECPGSMAVGAERRGRVCNAPSRLQGKRVLESPKEGPLVLLGNVADHGGWEKPLAEVVS